MTSLIVIHWSWRCLSPCWTARASCCHIGDNCKWGSIPRVWDELAEDKGTSCGLQGGYAINHQGSGRGRHGSGGVCLPWLSYPLINRKHLWHQPPKCRHSCCHAELRKSDLEVTARHLNEVEAVQHVHLTNIPVWFGVWTAGRYLRRTHVRSMHLTSGDCVCCLASDGTNLYALMMYGG